MNAISLLPAGLRSGATFVAALGTAGLLAQLTPTPPILVALMASIVAAGMALVLAAQDLFDSDYSSLRQISVHLVAFLTATGGLWGIVNIVPGTGDFVCEPLVPWHVSIAIIGAFGMSLLTTAARPRMPTDQAGLMIHLAFFWIAPFYGFFHAPWFLAQAIVLPCVGRPLAQAVVVVLGMVAAAIAGRRTATWMVR